MAITGMSARSTLIKARGPFRTPRVLYCHYHANRAAIWPAGRRPRPVSGAIRRGDAKESDSSIAPPAGNEAAVQALIICAAGVAM
ncbi:hypothetical protein MNEG_10395, partial [Monoraphidium neglectum]